MLIKEMEIYALGSLVDSGWMHLDGWRYRARKRGNARARIHREAWECCKLFINLRINEISMFKSQVIVGREKMEHLWANGQGFFEQPLTSLNRKQSSLFADEHHFPSECFVMKVLEEDLQSRGECFPVQNQQMPMTSEVALVTGHSEMGMEADIETDDMVALAGFAEAQKDWLRVTWASREAMREARAEFDSALTCSKQREKIHSWKTAGLKSEELFTQC
ncbi:uncharacterized protein F5891DRAFT_983253 [Suillus fuscotomentosus]|uniref:Uncharacterized protein n=1 Tax=Suillus fuscotomentosus TaxID=1912939 RepID=A0AAD4HGD3_9AGAM|nr:uncharacterized protein F5891DRAFT_983253 [Suillus fuscotomentosus]KAG1896640.1 hypothetical protein F5891DRAFT_983253 [Suillus fuscotomentosus]